MSHKYRITLQLCFLFSQHEAEAFQSFKDNLLASEKMLMEDSGALALSSGAFVK